MDAEWQMPAATLSASCMLCIISVWLVRLTGKPLLEIGLFALLYLAVSLILIKAGN